MQLLLVTNLYPPQELGGYGRSMADFVWGLEQLGHRVQVISSDAPYLLPQGAGATPQPGVERVLLLKGDFCQGVRHLVDPAALAQVDHHNQQQLRAITQRVRFDGVLLGNLDLA